MDIQTILIGDVGASSSKWALVTEDTVQLIVGDGFNPRSHTLETLGEALRPVTAVSDQIDLLFYYGTGIRSTVDQELVGSVLRSHFPRATIQLNSDMVAAALGTTQLPALVCILGTGSNSCLFDGLQISDSIPSLGYPLGDEGSGWRIGLALARNYYYRTMPKELASMFSEHVPEDHVSFLDQLRTHPAPNRHLASFARFAADNQRHGWIGEVVNTEFRKFLKYHVIPYQQNLPVHFVGGIAHAFREMLSDTIELTGFEVGSIVKDPLEGLIQFHKYNQWSKR